MTTFLNYTPHTINLNCGQSYPSAGVARVSASFTDFDNDGICRQQFGDVQGLPEPQDGVSTPSRWEAVALAKSKELKTVLLEFNLGTGKESITTQGLL